MDYSYLYKNIHFFGELAIDNNLNKAFCSGMLISMSRAVDFSVHYRDMGKGYQAISGNAISQSSTPGNEQGMYSGISFKPLPYLQINAYADTYHFPWLKYLVSLPAYGYDYKFQVSYQPSKKFILNFYYRIQNKPGNSSSDSMIVFAADHIYKMYQLQLASNMNKNIGVRGRIQILSLELQGQREESFSTYAEISYHQNKLRSSVRVLYFAAPDYTTRLYTFESGSIYNINVPAFYGRGIHYYFNIHYHLDDKINLFMRMSQTIYTNKNIISSSLDQINGNRKTQVEAQVQYFF
jgi:hypothetical protein